MTQGFIAVLAPMAVKFVAILAVLGPLSILGIIFFLKRIEKNDPDRIRWR